MTTKPPAMSERIAAALTPPATKRTKPDPHHIPADAIARAYAAYDELLKFAALLPAGGPIHTGMCGGLRRFKLALDETQKEFAQSKRHRTLRSVDSFRLTAPPTNR